MIAWLITGTRNLDDAGRRVVRAALHREAQTNGYPDLVIYGGCRGVDLFVADLCLRVNELGADIRLLELAADWGAHGKAAGPKRNEAMVKVALGRLAEGWTVRFFAFPRGESTGTRGCARLCVEAGIDGRVVELGVEETNV